MIYILFPPGNHPYKLIGLYEYQTHRSPGYLVLSTGKKWSDPVMKPHSRFKCNRSELLAYDFITDNSGVPIVNQRVRDLLNVACPEDVQYVDGVLECKDGLLEGYQYLNVIYSEDVIDYTKTRCQILKDKNIVYGFDQLVFKEVCLQHHGIARVSGYLSLIVVSENIRKLFDENDIKGLDFLTDEQFSSI